MVQEIPVTQARADFADLVNRVVYGDERIVVTRHGRPIVALVPAADLERLDALDRGEILERAGLPDPAAELLDSGELLDREPLEPEPLESEADEEPGRLVRLPSRPVTVAPSPAAAAARYDVAAEHHSPGRGATRRH